MATNGRALIRPRSTMRSLNGFFENYFNIFPWTKLPPGSVGLIWAAAAAAGRSWLRRESVVSICSIPVKMLSGSQSEISTNKTIAFFQIADAGHIPLDDSSCDFGYSLGVLHHIPDTEAGLRECTSKLKTGAPFLLYLYYSFDNRPAWFRLIWRISNAIRGVVCRLPHSLRYGLSQVLAVLLYWPLARGARLLERLGTDVSHFSALAVPQQQLLCDAQ